MTFGTRNRLLAFIGAALFVAACSAEGSPGPASDDDADESSTPVAGYKLEPLDLSKTARTSGTIEAVERIRLKSQIGGVLTTLNVEEGDSVRAGDILATSELAELRAELRRAQAEATKFRRQYERKKPLVDREAIRQAEVDDLSSELEIAESEVELWETRIELSQVRAPKDAVVTERHVDPGGYVSADEPIVDLADLSTLVVPVRLSERDVVHLDRDQPVQIMVDAYPLRPLDGSIRRVFPTADADSRRVTVEVAIDELPDDMVVQPGFLARLSLPVDRRDEALAIPDAALLASSPDDRFVYVIEDDHLVQRSVTTGVARRNLTEVVDGLEAGDVIVGTNPTNLREDTRVHVSEWVEVR